MSRILSCSACGLVLLVLAAPATAQFQLLRNLPGAPSQDGYLRIEVDDFGSFSSASGGDFYNPAGPEVLGQPSFTSGMFLFAGSSQRELLSDDTGWQSTPPGCTPATTPCFGDDASLDRNVTAAGVLSDTNADGIDDTLTSGFDVTGGGTNLGFDLVQTASVGVPGQSAVLQQTYTISNNGASPISFSMVRAHDGDIPYPAVGNFFFDDEVGTETNGSGGDLTVFMQNPGDPTTRQTISSPDGDVYYGGKNGIDPPPGGVAFGYGTDTQVWDNFGVPVNWEDFIAGVGKNINGVSGPSPPGVTASPDGFIGMGFDYELQPGTNAKLSVTTTYGVPEPTAMVLVLSLLGGLGFLRRR